MPKKIPIVTALEWSSAHGKKKSAKSGGARADERWKAEDSTNRSDRSGSEETVGERKERGEEEDATGKLFAFLVLFLLSFCFIIIIVASS